MKIIKIQEHEELKSKDAKDIEKDSLTSYKNNKNDTEIGLSLKKDGKHLCWFLKQKIKYENFKPKLVYNASYVVGAQWLNNKKGKAAALIIYPKKKTLGTDFIKMFMTCIRGGMASDYFNNIYGIDFDGERIETDLATTVLDPLLLCHFLSLVEKIAKSGLKKGYIYRNENLKKCRGRIDILKNERKNVLAGRSDRVYCCYSEYGVNIPENRLIKKALLIARSIFLELSVSSRNSLSTLLNRCLAAFENVDSDIQPSEIKGFKANKLYKGYSEAVDLAKIIFRRSGYSISESRNNQNKVPPFWINMSAMFEYYVLYHMKKKYGEKIVYQDNYPNGFYDFEWRPDYLFIDEENPMILDAKYIYELKNKKEFSDYVRQLSGYSRLKEILSEIGKKNSCDVPCVFLYAASGESSAISDFSSLDMTEDGLSEYEHKDLYKFYLVPVKLPKIK